MAKIVIIGRNEIGDRYWHFFKNDHEVYSFDSWSSDRQILNETWDLAVVCVETSNKGCALTRKLELKDFVSDYSLIQEFVEDCKANLFIIPTPIDPGTIDSITSVTNKNVVNLNWFDNFFIFGGTANNTKLAVEYFLQIAKFNCRYIQTDAKSCEFLRYAKEYYDIASLKKCNEIEKLCKKINLDFNLIRELWLNAFNEDLFKNLTCVQNEQIIKRFEAFKNQINNDT